MQKFVLTGLFIALLALLVQHPYPILEHEHLLTEYQMLPLGVQIKNARMKKQVSSQNLANLIKSTPEEIKKIEEGLLVPDGILLAKIQKVLDCKISSPTQELNLFPSS